MLSALAFLALAQGPAFTRHQMPNPGGGNPRLFWDRYEERLDPPKMSPKKFGDDPQPWEFDWVTAGYAQLRTTDVPVLRFQVFSQERHAENDLAPQVCESLLRLFDYNYRQLGLDHSQEYLYGIDQVYLCWGGKAGGEQLFGEDVVNGHWVKVNTIYIYDLKSFTDPVEKAREVAHEYGHASLPAVGGFEQPEDWANGYLGEKLYLTYLRDGMAKGSWGPEATMGATKEQLDKWIAANVEPLVVHAAAHGPEPAVLASKGPTAMNGYMGLALYMAAILPDRVFARSMKLAGSVKASDYPDGILLASVEPESYRLTIPPYLKGKPLWVPLGRGAISGASVLKRKGMWAQIQPGTGPVTIVPSHEG